MSEARFSRNFRHDYLELCADLLEGCYRGRGSGYRSGGSAYGGPCNDLLYDFVKLQATHFNQLARLGIAQAEYGRRLLEAWYGYPGGCQTPAPGGEVPLSGKHGEEAKGKFLVVNHCAEEVEFDLQDGCFRDLNNREEFNHDVAFSTRKPKVAAKNSELIELTVKLDNDKFLKGHSFASLIEIRHKGQVVDTRIICLEVH